MTLAELKARIASELHRNDLTTAIADALADAVRLYQSQRFRFNEARATFSTVDGTEFYSTSVIPSDIAQIDSLTVTVNGRQVRLDEWSHRKMEDIRTTTNTESQPWAWAWYADQIRLYPIPDQAYTITISYLQQIDLPASDASSNAWTTDAGALIRHTAKRMICAEYTQDMDGAAAAAASEGVELKRLKKEAAQLSTGTLRGSM